MGHDHTYPVIDNTPVPYNVYCLVQFKNHMPDFGLVAPAVYYKSGDLHEDGPYKKYPYISICDTQNTLTWCFRKLENCATGSGGVMTYKISGWNRKLQIMWSVPFNQDHYDNWFGVGIGSEAASAETFKKLYKGQDFKSYSRACSKPPNHSNSLSQRNYAEGIVISATMTMHHRAALTVSVAEIEGNPGQLYIQSLERLIEVGENLIEYLVTYIEKVTTFERVDASVNTANAAITVAGAGLVFTPFAPLGVACLSATAAHSVCNSALSSAQHKVFNNHLQIELDKLRMAQEDYEGIKNWFKPLLPTLEQQQEQNFQDFDEDLALFQLIFQVLKSGKSVVQKVHKLNEWRKQLPSVIYITKLAYHNGKNFCVVLKNGSQIFDELKVALYEPGILQGVGAASRVFKVFAVTGAIISVVSVIHEWATKTPNRLQGEHALTQVKQQVEAMKETLKQFQ